MILQIAGGIILAVLFFASLPLVLWAIIALVYFLIKFCRGILKLIGMCGVILGLLATKNDMFLGCSIVGLSYLFLFLFTDFINDVHKSVTGEK